MDLREQDIEKIVQTFLNGEVILGYSRFVKYTEILTENAGNLNVPRYIQKISDALPQNIAAHLKGGIPKADIDSLQRLWDISPTLQQEIFSCTDVKHRVYHLALPSADIDNAISQNASVLAAKQKETETIFAQWKASVRDILLGIDGSTVPRELIRTISMMLLRDYTAARLLDNYDVYDCLLNYWNAKLQDDVYILKTSGYEAGREIEYEYAKKKKKEKNGETVTIDDKSKVKSFDGLLIPREIIEAVYFAEEVVAINALAEQSAALEAELAEMREEESGEDGLLREVLSDKGDSVTKDKLNKRIKELEEQKESATLTAMERLLDLFAVGKTAEMEKIMCEVPELARYDIRNKNGSFGKTKLTAALKAAREDAAIPEKHADEYNALLDYAAKLAKKDEVEDKQRKAQKALDEKVHAKYGELTVEEIKHLLFDLKWMAKLEADIRDEVEQVLSAMSAKVLLIARRYERTLGEIEDRVAKSRTAVMEALERMGFE